MLYRKERTKVSLYKIEASSYKEIKDDFNAIVVELEADGEDGLYPITISRLFNEGATFTEIHVDMLHILRWDGMLGVLESPRGIAIQLNDRYETIEVITRPAYMLEKVSEDRLEYVGQYITANGHIFDCHSLNEEYYIERLKLWIDLNYSVSDIHNDVDVKMVKAGADYRDNVLQEKLSQATRFAMTGDGKDGLLSNPYGELGYTVQEIEH